MMKWLLLPALLLPGCGAPVYPYSCGNPQVPPDAYSVAQAQETLGTLIVKVVDPAGEAVPGATVSVTMEFTGSGPRPKCPGGLTGTTDPDGIMSLERMRPGLYSLQVLDDAGAEVVQVTIHPDQTAEVTLTKREHSP